MFKDKNKILNIYLHGLILFILLFVLFFSYISKVIDENLDNEMKNNSNEGVNNFLDFLNKLDEKDIVDIDWNNFEDIGLSLSYKKEDIYYAKLENVRKLKNLGIVIIFTLILVFLIFIYFFKEEIDLKNIFIENLKITFVISLVEIIFFYFVVQKYNPILPSDNIEYLLNELKIKINNL